MTGADLVTKALRKAGILIKTETPSADEMSDGIDTFNAMLGAWANESMLIYARTTENFPVTSGVNTYTIGTGQTFNTTKPVMIVRAYIRDSFDYPLEIITDERYASIQDKNTQSQPYLLNFNNNFPASTIKLYPTPAQAYTLFILSEKPLTSIAETTDVEFPPGWDEAIINNLAIRFGPEYGQEPSSLLVSMAIESKSAIRTAIIRNRSMDYSQGSIPGNIYTGWFR